MQLIHLLNNHFTIRFIIFGLVFFISCTHSNSKSKKNSVLSYFLKSYAAEVNGDNYAKLYLANPLLVGDPSNRNLLSLCESSSSDLTKKKLVLVHGWNLTDTDQDIPTDNSLKERILIKIWKDQLGTDFFTQAIVKGYSIYFFTYLTSNNIEKNGTRLRSSLDKAFGSEKGTVIIYAHSMGGLITKTALYTGDSPAYLSRIITTGTPFHGSPWASSSFQSKQSIIGDIASFLTNTDGGRGLAWDNFDGSLSSSTNAYLTSLSTLTSRNQFIYAYYGSLDKVGTSYAGSDQSLIPACLALGDNFSPSDCIVPSKSARYDNNTLGKTLDVGKYTHIDMNLRASSIRTQVIQDLP